MKRLVLITLFLCVALQVGICCSVVSLPRQVARNFNIELQYSGKPIQMQLSVSDAATGKVVRQVTTNAYGRAEVRNIEPGTYKVISAVSEDTIEVTEKAGSGDLHITALFDRAPIEVATVTGTITDPTGAAIRGAIVVLERPDNWHSPVAVTTADASGSISLQAIEGVYVLRVATQGFQTAVVPLKITPKGWAGFRLGLQVGGCPALGPPFTIQPKE